MYFELGCVNSYDIFPEPKSEAEYPPNLPHEWFDDIPLTDTTFDNRLLVKKIDRLPKQWYSGSMLVLSRDVYESTRQFERHLEVFPIFLRDTKGNTNTTDFVSVHLLRRVSCLDRERSQFECYDDGDVRQVMRMVVDELLVPDDRHLFKMKEGARDLISEQLRDEWLKLGVDADNFGDIQRSRTKGGKGRETGTGPTLFGT